MVNPGCDGSHKNRDLLPLWGKSHEIQRVNASLVVNRRLPDTIAMPWADHSRVPAPDAAAGLTLNGFKRRRSSELGSQCLDKRNHFRPLRRVW
jgi:hypothetical protein